MNKFHLFSILSGLLVLLASPVSMAQDVSINILAAPASLPQSTTGSIQVDVCNTDPANTPAVANALQPQITVGPNMTIVGVTALDGSPLTTFSVLSNSGQTIQLSNSAALPNAACVSFKVIIQGVSMGGPVGGGSISSLLSFGGTPPAGNQDFNDASTSSVAITAPPALPDLSPVIYVQPTVVSVTAPVSVVVDVHELNSVALTGTVKVRISRDASLVLSFDPVASAVGGHSVQNSSWSFNGSDPGYYELTAVGGVSAGIVLSFGLTGTLDSNNSKGEFGVSAVVLSSVSEQRTDNNTKAALVQYSN